MLKKIKNFFKSIAYYTGILSVWNWLFGGDGATQASDAGQQEGGTSTQPDDHSKTGPQQKPKVGNAAGKPAIAKVIKVA